MIKLLLSIAIISASLVCCSQDKSRISWGIKGGLSIASVSRELGSSAPPDYNNTSSLGRTKIGGFLQLPLSTRLMFQPEITLTGKGYREMNSGYPQSNRYSFLEIPLHLLYVWPGKRGSFMLGGGPMPAFKTSELYFYFPVRDFDLGADLLAIYQTPLGFSLQLNYTHGFSNIAYSNDIIRKIRSRSWGITVGYVF